MKMKWLVTVLKTADVKNLKNSIEKEGGEIDQENESIPLEESEIVLKVSGPSDLPDKLKSISDIIEVYPDSEMQSY